MKGVIVMLHSITKLDPHIHIVSISEETDSIHVVAFIESKSATCPHCHQKSCRAHSHYARVIDDLPIQNKAVRIYLRSKKWFCTNTSCESKVFTERYDWLLPSKQRTVRLEDTLRDIAFVNNCIKGAQLSKKLGMPTSHDTLLRIIYQSNIKPSVRPFCRDR